MGQGRPRLVAVDEAAITTPLDPYLSLRALAVYSGCSVRWLRDRVADAHHPLPCYRLPGGKILVRRSEFDGWIRSFKQDGRPNVREVVEEVLDDLRGRRVGITRTTGV